MTNIWGFLIQTLSVSLVVIGILIIKNLLEDKLPPRWQYGVWGILAARILLPVSTERYVILPLPVWFETWKAIAEKRLNSSFTEVYVPISIQNVFPYLSVKPTSLTDWLFVIYAVGVIVSFMWYLSSYLSLRRILRNGKPISYELKAKLQKVCDTYQLKACKAIMIEGLDSAFVCSGLRPILVLPEDKDIDEKVILHELLHLKYHDELQSIGWCVLRCLHWCNLFLQFVFCEIENDMEALCDQRVLERLEGEERREYGIILLSMVNEKYARIPGTSSISNGGSNISQRIEAIVRFKKYPKGMKLVSICSVIVMCVPVLIGNAKTEYTTQSNPYHAGPLKELEAAMAHARLDRCKTIAGALDTYAKGLAYENGLYIAVASPYEKHEELEKQMRWNAEKDGWRANYLYSGEELKFLIDDEGYGVFNLRKGDDGKYHAYLRFWIYSLLKEDGTPWLWDEGADNPYRYGTVLVPVSVWNEDGWVVEEEGERIVLTSDETWSLYGYTDLIPKKATFEAIGETGTIRIKMQTEHYIGDSEYKTKLRASALTDSLDLDAEFDDEVPRYEVEYAYTADSEGNLPEKYVGMQIAEMHSSDDEAIFTEKEMNRVLETYSQSGLTWINSSVYQSDGIVKGFSETGDLYFDKILEGIPVSYKARIYWDGEVVEELLLEEVYQK